MRVGQQRPVQAFCATCHKCVAQRGAAMVDPTEKAEAARISWVGTQPPLSVVRVLDCERDAA